MFSDFAYSLKNLMVNLCETFYIKSFPPPYVAIQKGVIRVEEPLLGMLNNLRRKMIE